jgi:hypothetical protein
MNPGKLKRVAIREFKRSPAKACVLLALLPVAAYFIGPLVWKKIPDSRARAVAAASGPELPTNAPAQPIVPATDWWLLAEQMARDARMRAAPPRTMRNPFRLTETPVENTTADADAAGAETEQRTESGIEQFSLRLTSTIVGQRLRMATINGKPYRENAIISFPPGESRAADGEAGSPKIVLKTVARKFVVLEHGGKLYQLNLAQ